MGLHIILLILAEVFRLYTSKGGQVFTSSHSPDLLNAAELDEVFCLKKERGYTKISSVKENPMLRAQCEAGNPLGYLWKSKTIIGIDPS